MPSLPGIVQPPRQLKGLAVTVFGRGKATTPRIDLDARPLSYWDVATHGWKVAPGDYYIEVGGSSRDIRLTGNFRAE